ncbi:expressed protein [Phakopsora pachyrhizi]|uniref:Expressed protein n=1 Tax=Phakopsora pachyrhizi TaxID=170000 RepID=A0AAV0BEC6_PHAPC|nr:expressed protein [Phakopsora pachyrhizi]
MNFRHPSPEQTEIIKNFIRKHPSGQTYRLDEKGNFIDVPKENWTLKYYCGRVIVVDDHGNELYNTGCCYCNASSQTNLNSAEILVNKCVYGFGKIALKIISALLGHEDRNRSSKRYGGK